MRRYWFSIPAAVLVAGAMLAIASACAREPTTPEERRQRGEQIVRAMSDRLAKAAAFTVTTSDTRDVVRNGRKTKQMSTRQFTVRRPDRMAVAIAGDGVNVKGWYDGQHLTFVSDAEKIWTRVRAAANIDDTLDRLAERFDMPMPMADFAYSSPYDALIGPESTGGYVGREPVDGLECVHVAFQHPGVDWDLWVPERGDPLPKRFRMVSKKSSGQPVTEVVFRDWNLAAQANDASFTPEVPSGYERILMTAFEATTVASETKPGGAR